MLDVGWIGSPRLRLVGDATWFIGELSEFVPQDDRSYSGAVFDLSASVSLLALGGSATARFAPYLSAGVGVHALSSAFGTPALDQRYNANRFALTEGAGFRLWVGRSGSMTLFAEGRAHQLTDVSRWSVRAGVLRNFGALVRPTR